MWWTWHFVFSLFFVFLCIGGQDHDFCLFIYLFSICLEVHVDSSKPQSASLFDCECWLFQLMLRCASGNLLEVLLKKRIHRGRQFALSCVSRALCYSTLHNWKMSLPKFTGDCLGIFSHQFNPVIEGSPLHVVSKRKENELFSFWWPD